MIDPNFESDAGEWGVFDDVYDFNGDDDGDDDDKDNDENQIRKMRGSER